MECRFCNVNSCEPVVDLGRQPLANKFLSAEDFPKEHFYSLEVFFCINCKLLQIKNQPSPKIMFDDSYKFYSQTSSRMINHFNEVSDYLKRKYLLGGKSSSVLEIGTNDGIFLQNFLGSDIQTLGVDPSSNVTSIATTKGIRIVNDFFGSQVAQRIKSDFGNFDLVYAANVICHIPDLRDLLEGVKTVIEENGVFVFEEPYLGSLVSNNSYDQIYDEHVYIFSASAVERIAAQSGFTLFECETLWTHGGSMRYHLAKEGTRQKSSHAIRVLEEERVLGIDDFDSLRKLANKFHSQANQLKSLLESLKNTGKRVVGYGATSKSATILNFADIGPDLIEYISDTTESKQNLFSPGKHIPIKSYEYFKLDNPDFVILFAWNHADEIFAKEQTSGNALNWIIPFPMPKVIQSHD